MWGELNRFRVGLMLDNPLDSANIDFIYALASKAVKIEQS